MAADLDPIDFLKNTPLVLSSTDRGLWWDLPVLEDEDFFLLFFFSSASISSFIFFSPSLLTPQVSSANFLASSKSSPMKKLSKMVPDFTCHTSTPTAPMSLYRYSFSSGV